LTYGKDADALLNLKYEGSIPTDLNRLSNKSLSEAVYYLTKMNRKAGFVSDPNTTQSVLSRIAKAIPQMDREDLIRILQVCSLSINRNKLDSGCNSTMKLAGLRDRVVQDIIVVLEARCVDIPTTSISVAFSSCARMYKPSVKPLMDELTRIITARVRKNLKSPEGPLTYMHRSDLHRTIPFIFLGYHQNSLPFPSELVDESVPLFLNFTNEIPYKHLSQYMMLMGSDDRLKPIRDYFLDRMANAPEDMTVMDLCRFTCNHIPPDIWWSAISTKRDLEDWDIHSLLELSRILRSSSTGIPKILEDHYRKASWNLRFLIPQKYFEEIFRNISAMDVDGDKLHKLLIKIAKIRKFNLAS